MILTWQRVKKFNNIYEAIKKHYGNSKYFNRTPTLHTYSDPHCSMLGSFDSTDMTIWLNVANCRNTNEAVQTLIHEYVHYLQPPTWYTRYHTSYRYDEHPYEIQANEIAKNDAHLFLI